MMSYLKGLALNLALSAVALTLAAVLLPGFHMRFTGFLTAVIVFVGAQALVSMLVARFAQGRTPLLGAAGSLISTFLALLIANGFLGGLSIRTAMAWFLGTVIVWGVTGLGDWALPRILSSRGKR